MINEISGDFLQWLRGFYFVVEKGSLTEAAIAMGRQQPAITHQIKSLEKELGVFLFDRSSGKMKLTTEGKVLFGKAISLFEVVKDIKSDFRKQHIEYEGKIVVATSQAIVDFFLPRYVLKFRSTHPHVKFDIEGMGYGMIFETVESAEADFGIAYIDSVPKTMVYYDLFETGQTLIAPKNNTFFPGRLPTLKQIARAPLILFSRSGSIDPPIERRFSEEKLSFNVVMTLNNFVSVKKYVALGMGIAILGGHAVSPEDKETIDVFPLDRYFPKRRYGLILRKTKYLSPSVKAFIRTIKPDIQFPK